MLKADYHTHSSFSPDAWDTPLAMSRRAYELGLSELALTEHAEWENGGSGFRDPDDYFAAIESCRRMYGPLGLAVHAGVELGNPHDFPDEAGALLQAYPFDIVIGSVHWLDGANIHSPSIFKGTDPDRVFQDYFTEIGLLSAGFDVDIIAHFDRILRSATAVGVPFDPWRYEDTIRASLEHIARRGQVLELNTYYLGRKNNWRSSVEVMLGWYREEGGRRVAINSDAHRTTDLGANFDIARQVFQAAGFDAPVRLGGKRTERVVV